MPRGSNTGGMNRSRQNLSLRNLFRSRGRENSLSLEDLAGVSSPVVKQPSSEEEQDAGIAAAMSITRLFLKDNHYCHEEEWREDDEAEGGSGDRRQIIDEQRLGKVLEKVNKMRAEHDEKVCKQQLRINDLQHENAELRARLRCALNDAEDRHKMSEYAKLITEAMPASVIDSSYVLKLQSQLCKALHKVGMLSNQIELMESQEMEKVKELQTQLVEQGNESFRAEVGHMNDLLEMEKEMEHLKEELESESNLQQDTIAKIEVELELERSLRCDAMSYARKVKEERLHRKRRMSKRGSDASNVTDIIDNMSDGHLEVEYNDNELDEQVKEPIELDEPLRNMFNGSEDDTDNNGNDDSLVAGNGDVVNAATKDEHQGISWRRPPERKMTCVPVTNSEAPSAVQLS